MESLIQFLVCEFVFMFCHYSATGQSMPQWSDLPTVAAVMFGASPYGQLCWQWVKEKLGKSHKER